MKPSPSHHLPGIPSIPGRQLYLIVALTLSATIACGSGEGKETGQDPTKTTTSGAEDSASETSAGTSAPTAPTTDPTTSDDPTGDDSTSDGGVPFFPYIDGGTPTIACDVFKQDCDLGEKCTAWAEGGGGAWNATKCVKVTGTKVPGDVCMTEGGGVSGIDDCEAGAMCWDVSHENLGICVALCQGSPEAPTCAAGFACTFFNEGVLNLCLPVCDPLVQDCDGDDLCIPNSDTFVCVLDASGEEGQQNDPCEFPSACDKGLACIPSASASGTCMQSSKGCCQPFCEFIEGQDGTCPNPDQKCLQWFDPMMEIPPGLEDVGICAIPL